MAACAATNDPAPVDSAPDLQTLTARPGSDLGYAKDNELRLNQLQARGTHNSYHIYNGNGIGEHQYTHKPLQEQLADQGVRQFELDVYYYEEEPYWRVLHIPEVDPETTCATFAECLESLWAFSKDNPGHHTVFVLVELKGEQLGSNDPVPHLDELDQVILDTLPVEALLTPQMVQGSAASVREAVTSNGWPTLAETRGKIAFFIQAGGDVFDAYTHDNTSLDGRVMFVDVSPPHPAAAILARNDPYDESIPALVDEGYIVRTRADAALGEGEPEPGRLAQARNSGAQLLSGDFPVAGVHPSGYFLELTGGTPSLCNPRTAPADCKPEDIESPQRLH